MGSSIHNRTIMKTTAGIVALLGASGMASLADWNAWKQQHGISFAGHEDRVRYGHFLRTAEFIRNRNERYEQGLETYHVAHNKFSSMPNEEFMQKYMMEARDVSAPELVTEYSCPQAYTRSNGHPSSHSWKGSQVTNVKDQGSCGSCWTFGAGAAIEGAMCAAGMYNCNNWHGVSEQQLVDCASNNKDLNPYDNSGCNGGFQSNALRYVIMNGGIDSWDSYGYTSGSNGREHNCAYNSRNSVGTISDCGRLGHANDEDLLCDMVYNKGVTTVAMDASGIGFQTYSGGIYNPGSCSSTRLNHAVTCTGYGHLTGGDYFEIKNSWGTSWGDNGYMYIARNGHNTCGVASEGQYAIL